uniref:ATP synthase F0 subunit 8 n=1 Tax=Dorylomorpha alaskensis TaxID=3058151 RepID=UPI0026E2FB36|nr:ATP synthase F0 subunit 8 [Dorylomorpha alaskensis]WJW73622.1 ATP synthase F0 subunit 8 [Dorylomorpha alaskensis]
MPQMAPISWLSLFIIFSISFMMFNIFNYYNFMPILIKSKTQMSKTQNSMNWKW